MRPSTFSDTFVVDSAGFNGLAWLDQAGYPATSALRFTERFRRHDFGHMNLEMTIDDPKMYTRPWTLYSELVFQADTEGRFGEVGVEVDFRDELVTIREPEGEATFHWVLATR